MGATPEVAVIRVETNGQFTESGASGTGGTTVGLQGSTTLSELGGNAVIEGGLGVANAADASTPGSVVKKIAVFDADGNSLGFLPVYSTIS